MTQAVRVVAPQDPMHRTGPKTEDWADPVGPDPLLKTHGQDPGLEDVGRALR